MANRSFVTKPLPKVISYLALIGIVAGVGWVLWKGNREGPQPNVSRVPSEMRSLATALESYFVDHEAYPAMRSFREEFGKNRKALMEAGGWNLSYIEPGRKGLEGLTTPVAYITGLFTDRYAPDEEMSYAYYTDGDGWVLFSAGPDRIYDINPAQDYDSALTPEEHVPLILKRYDPTNGTLSSGDIWRIGQR